MSQGAQVFTCSSKLMEIIKKKKFQSDTGWANNSDLETFESIKNF